MDPFAELHAMFARVMPNLAAQGRLNYEDYYVNETPYCEVYGIELHKEDGVYHVDHDGYEDVMQFTEDDPGELIFLVNELEIDKPRNANRGMPGR